MRKVSKSDAKVTQKWPFLTSHFWTSFIPLHQLSAIESGPERVKKVVQRQVQKCHFPRCRERRFLRCRERRFPRWWEVCLPCTALVHYPARTPPYYTPGTPCTPADTTATSMPAPHVRRRDEDSLGSRGSHSLGKGGLRGSPGPGCHPSSGGIVREDKTAQGQNG